MQIITQTHEIQKQRLNWSENEPKYKMSTYVLCLRMSM